MTTTAATGSGDRADARRNRAKVLAAAGEALAEQGVDVPLGEIARRAGVGAGTVYRHFPSKEALLEAVFVQHLTELVAAAERRAARYPATEAFFGFLLDVVENTRRRGDLCDVVGADASWPRPVLKAAALRFRQVLAALLRAAQQAGGVRTDVGPEDVVALVTGCSAMVAARNDRAAGRRLVQLTLNGLRPTGSVTPVTEQRYFRDNPDDHRAAGPARCEECGTALTVRPTGRPIRFCGATCRQRAHRSRPARTSPGEP